jgi:hypothetical protein
VPLRDFFLDSAFAGDTTKRFLDLGSGNGLQGHLCRKVILHDLNDPRFTGNEPIDPMHNVLARVTRDGDFAPDIVILVAARRKDQ